MPKRILMTGLLLVLLLATAGVSEETWKDLVLKSRSLAERNEYDSAIALANQALELAQKQYGDSDTITAKVYYYLGRYFVGKGDYPKSAENFNRALKIFEQNYRPDHPDIARCLNSLGLIYTYMGKYELAESAYIRALEIKENVLPEGHPDIANSLEALAMLYEKQDKYSLAHDYRSRAIAIRKKTQGEDHPDLAMSLNSMGDLLRVLGEYSRADSLFQQALGIQQRVLEADHPAIASTLNNYASLCCEKGQFEDAIKLYMQSMQILKNAHGPDHPDVATVSYNLALCYFSLGDYSKAEPLYKRACAITETAFGRDNPITINYLNTLANLYLRMGRYDDAEPLYQRALEIAQSSFGENHVDVATSCSNLGFLYFRRMQYDKAEPLFRKALKIYENSRGKDHPDVANSQENLARLLTSQGLYAEADSLFTQAIFIYQKSFGDDYYGIARLRQYKAELYIDMQRYAEADSLYTLALRALKQSLAPTHSYVGECMISYSKLLRTEKRYAEALEMAWQAYHICRHNYLQNYLVLSERDALLYFDFLRAASDNFLSCYYDNPQKDKILNGRVAEMAFSCKGRVSDCIFERQKRLIAEEDTLSSSLADSLKIIKYKLSQLFVKGFDEDVQSHIKTEDILRKIANDLEAELARKSASFKKRRDLKNISVEKIASILPRNSILIEYLKYNYLQLDCDSVLPHYLALVLASNGEPVIIDLGNVDSIDSIVGKYREHILRIAKTRVIATDFDLYEYGAICHKLYAAIWQPFEKYITDAVQLFIAPDGALNMISFAGLLDNQGRYFVENYALQYLSSGRDMVRYENSESLGRGLFALGDPDFNADIAARRAELPSMANLEDKKDAFKLRGVPFRTGDIKDICVSPLPGTRKEIESIIAGWRGCTDEPVFTYFGSEASEDNFKSEACGKRVIHLATHGYFLEVSSRHDRKFYEFGSEYNYTGENPLLLSGLFLAGGNLHGEGADTAGLEDGILTAYEVSAMDFSGVELVVLSACETGLGMVQEGEGVYGLRRAFQMGGARTVISALWPVSDKWTADLMSGLYNRQDQTIPDQIREKQLEIIGEFRNQGKNDHPFSWAGFIALGDWR